MANSDETSNAALFGGRLFDSSLPKIPYFTGENEDVVQWLERFEKVSNALGMSVREKFSRLPVYLVGTASCWYNVRAKPGRPNAPTNYTELINALLTMFTPVNYTDNLRNQLRSKTQQLGQPVKSYIFEMMEIAYRIEPDAPDQFVISVIKQAMLPGIEMFLNILPHATMNEFLSSAEKAEKSYLSSLKITSKSVSLEPKNNGSKLECAYCKRPNHTYEKCYKRIRDLGDKPPANETAAANITSGQSWEAVDWGTPSLASAITTSLINNRASLLKVQVKIDGRELVALVDTGAELSLIAKTALFGTSVEIKPYTGPPTYVADKRRLNILGECCSTMEISTENDNVKIISKLIVVHSLPANFDMILGQNILRFIGAVIDLSKNSLKIGKTKNDQPQNDDEQGNDETTDTEENVKNNEQGGYEGDKSEAEEKIDKELQEDEEESHSDEDSELDEFWSDGSPERIDTLLGINSLTTSPKEVISKDILKLSSDIAPKNEIKLLELLNLYSTVFALSDKQVNQTNLCTHSINVGDHPPIYSHPYRQSQEKQLQVRKIIGELLARKIIRHSKSPWASPVVLVPKKTGDIRFCVDYRKLNAITKKDAYPIPDIQLVLDALDGACFFSSLDLRNGYYQISMTEEDVEKTAFITYDGLFEFLVMPFGLTNAPATFQRMMNLVLDGVKYKFAMVYLDDILVFSKTFADHLSHLEEVFKRLKEAGLTLKPSKCSFLQSSLLYLGYIISKDGQKPNPSKVEQIKKMPPPTDLTTLRSFVGMCSYYRKFVPEFSVIAEPLHRLTKNNTIFCWEDEQQRAFEQLKQCLSSEPILRHYDPKDKIQVRTDASNYGLSAIILQSGKDNGYQPVAYASRLLRGAEKNYSIADRECLAIIFGVEKFRHYLEGRYFELVTDNCALCFLQSKNKLPPRLMRYSMLLQEFNFTIMYKSGKVHHDADCLSRLIPDNEQLDSKTNDDNFLCLNVQQSDVFCRSIIDQLKSLKDLSKRKQRRLQKYIIEDGKLFRQIRTQVGVEKRFVVPKVERKKILELYHDSPLGGHFGITKTTQNIKQRYYWPRMLKDITGYVQTCDLCQRLKEENQLPRGSLQPIGADYPFQKVGIDFVGPLNVNPRKTRYLLVCTDLFTRWAETASTSSATTNAVAEFLLVNIILRHGTPQVLISDRGKAFANNVLNSLLEKLKVKHILTSAYHPQSNGACEKTNQTICKLLSTLAHKEPENWDLHLPMATFSYNCSTNLSTKFSPFYLLFGRLPTLSIDESVSTNYKNLSKYEIHLRHYWPMIRELSLMNSLEAKQAQKENHDNYRRTEELNSGDEVLIRTLPVVQKIGTRFEGPYVVAEKKGPNNYAIKRKNKTENFHIERLKKYNSRGSLSLLNILFLLLILPLASCVFDTVPGVVWRKLPKFVARGQYEIQVKIILENPCDHLIKNVTSRNTRSPPISRYRQDENEDRNIYGHIFKRYNQTNWFVRITGAMDYPTERFCQMLPEQCGIIQEYIENGADQLQSDLSHQVLPNQTWHLYHGDPEVSLWETSLDAVLKKDSANVFQTIYGKLFMQLTKNGRPIYFSKYDSTITAKMLGMKYSFEDTKSKAEEAKRKVLEKLKSRCEMVYEQNFIEPMKALCRKKSDKRKRLAPFIIPMVIASIPGIISTAVGAANTVLAVNNKAAIKDLEKQAKIMIERDEKIRQALLTLQNNINLIAEKYSSLESRVATLEQIIADLSFGTGLLINKLAAFARLFHSLRSSKLDPFVLQDLLNEFNITLPCGDKCPVELTSTFKCEHHLSTIDLFLSIEGIDTEKMVISADPFFLQTHNSTTRCIQEWDGPKFLILNIQTGKKCNLNSFDIDQVHRQDTRIINLPEFFTQNCEVGEVAKQSSLWKIKSCSNLSEATNLTPQIKTLPQENYIYCYESNVTLFHKTYSCPNSVFRLSKHVNFSIGLYRHEVHNIVINTIQAYASTSTLNHIANLAISSESSLVLKPIDLPELDKVSFVIELTESVLKNPWVMIPLMFVFSCLSFTLAKLAFTYCQNRITVAPPRGNIALSYL